MKVPSVADKCAAREIEIIEDVGSGSNNPEKNFQLLDSTYSAAADGVLTEFQQHGMGVYQILTPNGNTILHIYIRARRRTVGKQERKTDDFVRGILEMCPDLLWKANERGETLLHMAARHGHADVAKFLLDECNQNHDQEHGMTPREMLQIKNEAEDTALHEAVRYNYLDVVEILTKKDPNLPYGANSAHETPLYLAAERQHAGVLKAILDICDSPADGGPFCRTALHMAVFHNNEEMTTSLLAKETTRNSGRDRQGWTPLHFAAHFGYIEILKKLLDKDKCAAYTADHEGKTALHVAAAGGKVEIMQELLSTCPGCYELVDKRRRNVLHFALIKKGNVGAIRLVLRNRSLRNLVNDKDEDGNTPLLQAASMGDICSLFRLADHDKADKLVFNCHNHNAADMISANKSRVFPTNLFPSLTLWWLKKYKVSPAMRTRVSENEDGKSKNQEGEVKEEEEDTRSSENKDIKEMGALGLAKTVMENNLTAATLIATVSFAAGIAIPGGFITDKGPHQGTAILTGNAAFKSFVVFNTTSFFLSSLAVLFHLLETVSSSNIIKRLVGTAVGLYLTLLAMIAMMLAFISGTQAVLKGRDQDLASWTSSEVVAWFLLLVVAYNGDYILSTLLKMHSFMKKKKRFA